MEYQHRKYIRYNGYDYTSPGEYFITVVVNNRRNVFGEITNDTMHLNDAGKMVINTWNTLVERFDDIDIDDKVVMPNHVHFMITHTDIHSSVTEVMRQFKAITSHEYNKGMKEKGWMSIDNQLWQRNYFDRIVRSRREYEFERNYIYRNPERWDKDKLNADCVAECDNIGMVIHNIQMHKDYNPEHYFDK